MLKETLLPPEISAAASALLKPYGFDLESLLNRSSVSAETAEKRFYTFSEAANYTGFSRFTLARQVKAGNIPQIKLTSTRQGSVIFDRADLEKFMLKLKTQTQRRLGK